MPASQERYTLFWCEVLSDFGKKSNKLLAIRLKGMREGLQPIL